MSRLTYILIFSILLFPGTGHAEYLRATDSEEVILISTDTETKIGKSMFKDIREKFGIYEDVALQKRIDSIGQKLAAVCDRKDIKYRFYVLEGKDLKPEQRINAFAVPGGYVYIFKDMVGLMESDDEIAGVLSHEVGHIAAKHSVRRTQGSLGALALNLVGAQMASDNRTKMQINNAIGHLMLSYSREDEKLADKLSVRYMKKAGYNPEAILNSIDKMIEKHRATPPRIFTGYQTHPYLAERKSNVKKEIYGRIDFVDFINEPPVPGRR